MKNLYLKCKDVYLKYKEIINYLIFGVLTFIVSMVSYYISRFAFNIVVSNVISWILAVIFAYCTNKKFVFESKTENKKDFIKEFSKFVSGRLFTLVLETAILWIMADLIGINDLIVKIIAQIVVIVTNYVLSKLIIFKTNK
jgi:putative flippase GtrA